MGTAWGCGGHGARDGEAGTTPGPWRQHTERAPRPVGSDAVVPGRHSSRHHISQEERRSLCGVRGRGGALTSCLGRGPEELFTTGLLGDDEQSTQMAASWEDEKVTEASSNSFVAIKIDTQSEACLQFSQIYPVVCVPSSFFFFFFFFLLETMVFLWK